LSADDRQVVAQVVADEMVDERERLAYGSRPPGVRSRLSGVVPGDCAGNRTRLDRHEEGKQRLRDDPTFGNPDD